MSHSVNLAFMLCVLTTVGIPTVHCVIQCYVGDNPVPQECNSDKCLTATCSKGGTTTTVKGFVSNSVVNKVDAFCREIGSSYKEATVKYCNCDGCNGDVMTCETSAPQGL